MIYGVVSDIHAHAWSAFSSVDQDGVNSRLRVILNELWRAAETVHNLDGKYLIVAGDIFHVRGSLDPEVLNPVQATFRHITKQLEIEILAIPGNHDLKSNDVTELGNAIQTLIEPRRYQAGTCFTVVNEATSMVIGDEAGEVTIGFVPYRAKMDDVLHDLESLKLGKHDYARMDVFIHAGINGVIAGLDHGLAAADLAKFGFRNVFAGHYHNHKDLGSGVWSIGALTHQTWSDVGSKAGFLLVDGATGKVTYQASHAPRFVDVTGMTDVDMELECDGNYVRFRGDAMKVEDINALRKFFTDAGALGTSISVPKATAVMRTGATAGSGMTLDQSVSAFVDADKQIPAHVDKANIKRLAAEVLAKSRAVYDEA